ncbi:MAG: YcxB family protein [Cyclobacteriaceae bacterium]
MSDSEVKTKAVEFEVSMDLKTFKGFQRQMLMRKPVFYIGPFILLMLLAQMLLDGISVENLRLIDFLPAVFILSVLLVLLPYSVNKGIVKAYNSNKLLQEKALYRIDNKSIFIKGETYENQIALNNILKYKEHKEFILLYQSNKLAMFIPKSSLQGNQLHALQAILRENVPSK